MADAVSQKTLARIPPPPGRKLALMLITGAIAIALVITFLGGGGVGRRLREGREDADRVPPRPAEGPADAGPAPRERPLVPTDPFTPRGPPPRPPAERAPPPVPTPEGLSVGLARELGGRLASLAAEPEAARAALRELPRLVASAPEERREEVRTVVLFNVAIAARNGPLRAATFDAALAIGAGGEPGKAVLDLAREALDDDAAAAPALLLLAAQPDAGGAAATGRMDALVSDAYRPLHLRVLAARLRPREGRPDAVTRLADDPTTPAPLRDALR